MSLREEGAKLEGLLYLSTETYLIKIPKEIGQSVKVPKYPMEPPKNLVVNRTTKDEVLLGLNLSKSAYLTG